MTGTLVLCSSRDRIIFGSGVWFRFGFMKGYCLALSNDIVVFGSGVGIGFVIEVSIVSLVLRHPTSNNNI